MNRLTRILSNQFAFIYLRKNCTSTLHGMFVQWRFTLIHTFAHSGHFSIMYVSMEVAFDSIIFLLTASRTVYMHYHRRKQRQQHRWSTPVTFRGWTLLESLLKDGALYFAYVMSLPQTNRSDGTLMRTTSAIFSINLTWVVMILHAPTGLRAIAGQYVSFRSGLRALCSFLDNLPVC